MLMLTVYFLCTFKTVWILIRLILEEQFDQVLPCLFSDMRRLFAFAHVINYFQHVYWAVRTLIRLILEEQSDLVLHSLLYIRISGLHAVVDVY